MPPPDPSTLYPIDGIHNTVFLRPLLAEKPHLSNVAVGDYTYYSDFEQPLAFFERNVLYNFGFSRARLDIGRYCAIAHGTTFIMDDANHAIVGPSTYPFPALAREWNEVMPIETMPFHRRGSISVGHDVWFGYQSLVLPGVRIGSGAIVGARAVVSRDVPDYAVVVGNPARVVRQRFPDGVVERLVALAWWDWPPERVQAAVPHLVEGSVDALEALAEQAR